MLDEIINFIDSYLGEDEEPQEGDLNQDLYEAIKDRE